VADALKTTAAVTIDRELASRLLDQLMLICRGGIPSPETAAPLLQRLSNAVQRSRTQG
jgi:hypothetical protein